MALPLEGVRILDLSVFQQGPVASAMLADMGADVIKIESLGTPDPGRASTPSAPNGLTPYFQQQNRNKRGICLDLKNEAGRELFLRLIETADIFHSNMRPGVLERLDLTYDVVSQRNPRIIVSHATGWGHLGPDAEAQLGSFDGLAQARGGLMSVNGRRECGPHSVNMPIADQVGAMMGAFGMMVALYEREHSGLGQEVNTSLYGSQMFMQAFGIVSAIWNNRAPQFRGADEARPHWASYPTSDGGLLMMAGSQPDKWWADFCDVMGVPECAEGVYTTNSFNPEWCKETRAKLVARFLTATRDEWMAKLTPKFFVQPVANYLDIARDAQAWANSYLSDLPLDGGDAVTMVGTPVHLSRTPATLRTLAPELGQHTEEVLLEAGYDWPEIVELREQGAFGQER